MSDELQTLDGVGPARADELVANGFESIPSIAASSPGAIASGTSISSSSAEEIIEHAKSVAGGETVDAETTDVETLETDDNDEDSETEIASDDTEDNDDTVDEEVTKTATIDADRELAMHILHIVLEEATSQRQSSNRLMQANAYTIAAQLCEAIAADSYPLEVSGTQSEINALYRALSNGESDYASRSGIPEMYGTFASIRDDVNDVRSEF